MRAGSTRRAPVHKAWERAPAGTVRIGHRDGMKDHVDRFLHGPHLRLPRPIDAISDWWSGRPPRVRMVAGALLVVATVLALDARATAIDDRWGGTPRTVLVATQDLKVGDEVTAVRRLRVPPTIVPPDAVSDVGSGRVLALALPEGAIVTASHLDARGAAVGLGAGMRAVPIPTEPGWGVVDGGWVDVWTLGGGDEPSELVAQGRPVVDVITDSSGLTSLVGLDDDEAAAVTRGLALGRVLLAHSPGPGDEPG